MKERKLTREELINHAKNLEQNIVGMIAHSDAVTGMNKKLGVRLGLMENEVTKLKAENKILRKGKKSAVMVMELNNLQNTAD